MPRVFATQTRARDFVSHGNNGGTKSIPQVTCPPRPRPRRRNIQTMADTNKATTLYPSPVISTLLVVVTVPVTHSGGTAMPQISSFTPPNTPSEVPNTAHSCTNFVQYILFFLQRTYRRHHIRFNVMPPLGSLKKKQYTVRSSYTNAPCSAHLMACLAALRRKYAARPYLQNASRALQRQAAE